ncbi:MAG: hypothetical protein OES84_00455 [Kiritimatiellaceae bacterium]|nr:hypothetical protein [Kiritimatiellaceae bacterium]
MADALVLGMLSPKHSKKPLTEPCSCLGFQGLKNWQVQQYRSAVDEHRVYLSRKTGRCVEWIEAELDFMTRDYDSHAAEWRTLYCSLMCPNSNNCMLAARFMQSAQKSVIHLAG